MRILLLAHSFNGLTQRLHAHLREAGHDLAVELDIADAVTLEAATAWSPDLILAPFLKRAIPPTVWQRWPCWIVHPGVPGDRGPSALDRAIDRGEAHWGVTVLQANGEFDAGDVWAHVDFPMRAATKGSLYRREVTDAAVRAVDLALARWATGGLPEPQAGMALRGAPHALMTQAERRIDWARHGTAEVLARLRAADGAPGVLDALFGQPCHLFDAHPFEPRSAALDPAALAGAAPGAVVARRHGAVLRRTVDGAVWIGHARPAWPGAQDGRPFKLPVAALFPEAVAALRDAAPAWAPGASSFDDGELAYDEQAGVGRLVFDFHNGAMSAAQCRRLAAALRRACARPIQALLLLGGEDFFSNGIHLNMIEAAASAADASWDNILAMNEAVHALLSATGLLTFSVLRGNAGAGGAFLALAADEAWAHGGVVLNPHYRNMGNLYGSEYWTWTLPRRCGAQAARDIPRERLPWGARQALQARLLDRVAGESSGELVAAVTAHARALVASGEAAVRIEAKRAQRAADEAERPLQAHADDELTRMRRNFYGFDPSYHVARYHFVRKLPHAWTPRHLAPHR